MTQNYVFFMEIQKEKPLSLQLKNLSQKERFYRYEKIYQEFSKMYLKIKGAQIVASDSTMNFGVVISNFPQVIFSFGTAPEYDP